mgnify:CR=1 FL=1
MPPARCCACCAECHGGVLVQEYRDFSSSGASRDDFSVLVDESAAFVPLPVRINAVRNWEGKEVNCRNGEKEVSK